MKSSIPSGARVSTRWLHGALLSLGLVGGAAFSMSAHAVTAANTPITNTATATFEDASGASFTSTSNVATIRVAQIYAATIAQDNSVVAAPGAIVKFFHTLTNGGNGTDTYTLKIEDIGANSFVTGTLKVYWDKNRDGNIGSAITDPLVASVGADGTVQLTLDAGVNPASLIVVGTVPGTLGTGTLQAKLTASTSNGTVLDLTTNGGVDTNAVAGTNHDTVTVTGDAVLEVTKSSTYIASETTNFGGAAAIEYTIQVKNKGNSPAYNVELSDILDATWHDTTSIANIVVTDTQGEFIDTPNVPNENGVTDWTQAANLCQVSDGTTCTAPTAGVNGANPIATTDVKGDNATTTTDIGIRGHDDILPINTTISVTFRVKLKAGLAAGTQVKNTATVQADTDGDGSANDAAESAGSNTTNEPIPAIYSVIAVDTNTGNNANLNDGGDDDAVTLPNNDVQYVTTVPAGGTVLLKNIIQNRGNVADTFELSINNAIAPGTCPTGYSGCQAFPTNTVFQFYNGNNTTPLNNTNGNATVDTGLVQPGVANDLTITVRAILPAGVSGTGPFVAQITATSVGDSSKSDTKFEVLGAIQAPGVDLSNTTPSGSGDQEPFTVATNVASPTTTKSGLPGTVVTFPLFIQNDGGTGESFSLTAGSSWNGTALGALHNGWSVAFFTTGGSLINGDTPVILGGATFEYEARVTIPTDFSQALANAPASARDVNADSTADAVDGNSDSDQDYPIVFRVVGNSSATGDVKLDAVDVSDKEVVSLVSGQSGQVVPGANITYNHTLSNNGNTVEVFTLAGSNTATGWSNGLLVDTTGDGTPDTAYSSLTAGTITVSGGTATVTIVGGVANIELQPGQSLILAIDVQSAATSKDGDTDKATLTASYNAGASSIAVEDTTTVTSAGISLVKTVAPDENCDGTPDQAFAQTQSAARVSPHRCAIWQLVATNTGDAAALKVKVSDPVPGLTTYFAGSLKFCNANAGTGVTPAGGCTLAALTDAGNVDEGDVNADFNVTKPGEITYFIGSGSTNVLGGTVSSGASVTLRFTTQVDGCETVTTPTQPWHCP